MQIIITDTGNIWNEKNPYLRKLKDIILVVCFNGKPVSDEYECLVVPPGEDRLEALMSIRHKLVCYFPYHHETVFLTDNEPSSLYPFYVANHYQKYHSMHLVSMGPWEFETNGKQKEYYGFLENLQFIDSFLHYDPNTLLENQKEGDTIDDLYERAKGELGELLPTILNGIRNTKYKKYYFDFSSCRYIPLRAGFSKINMENKKKKENKFHFKITKEWATLGLVIESQYPKNDVNTKADIEEPVARIDGKRICNILREQRIRLAQANHINFESKECPSIGPCAGICTKCDAETAYLRKEMNKIPLSERIYPVFNVKEEMEYE